MVRIPLIGKGRKEEQLNIEDEATRQALLSAATQSEDEVPPALEPSLPLMLDSERTVKSIVQEGNPFSMILPMLEPRLGVTNLDMTEIHIFQWSTLEILTCIEIEMEEDDYNIQHWAFSEALKNLLNRSINDSKVGWKMRELSTLRRHVAVGKGEEKRPWWKR